MISLSLGVMWIGYAVLAYGWGTVRSCNFRFRDIALPAGWIGASYTGCHPDSGSPGNQTSGGGPVIGKGSKQCPPGYSLVNEKGDLICKKNIPGGPFAPGSHGDGKAGA